MVEELRGYRKVLLANIEMHRVTEGAAYYLISALLYQVFLEAN